MPSASMPPSTEALRRVALYGGSFNPPHLCHVMVATYALTTERFDEVRLMPALGHAWGKALASFEVRCAMIEEAIGHLAPRVKLEAIEGDLPAPSYTVDTVRALKSRHPDLEITLIVGTDTYAKRAQWKEATALASEVGWLVVGRGAADDDEDVAVPTRFPDVSSTEVRRRVAAGETIDALVPSGVARLIDDHGLYR